jgi:hypothetical protein
MIMNTSERNPKSQTVGTPKEEIQKGIENHKLAARHYEAAAKHHHEAAKHHENGHHDKAGESAKKANEYSGLAYKAQKEDMKQHAPQL